MAAKVTVEVGDRTLTLSNLDKVLYPRTGFTKAQVIEYYTRIAPVMLPHIGDRALTLRRYPDGVEGKSFFEKRCPSHRPDWVSVAIGPGDRNGTIEYCRLDETAALVWTANLAAIELHSPMARCSDLETPTMLVFDLDPGAPATITQCCAIALAIRDVLGAVGLEAFAKTSGSKGMQLYVPLNTPHTHDHVSSFALAVGQLLEKQRPTEVLTNMKRSERPGKVLIDWSQNSRHKTTIAPYSLRARPEPTVSTPISWDEVTEGADGAPLTFTAFEVLDRIHHLGDLFAPTLTLEQTLPGS
ncbi:MAG: non-homologous end-joining DNA ligase [Acidimicrobiales bacterium]